MAGKSPAELPDDDARQQARQLVQGPAIGLLITGALNSLVATAIAFVLAWKMSASTSSVNPMAAALLVALAVSLFCSGFVIFGALKMMRLEAYRWAIAASILAILISPSNVISLAIGIWSLVVLSRADVRTAFARRGRVKSPLGRPRREKGGSALRLWRLTWPRFHLLCWWERRGTGRQ